MPDNQKQIQPGDRLDDVFLNMSALVAHTLIRDSIQNSKVLNVQNLYRICHSKEDTTLDTNLDLN